MALVTSVQLPTSRGTYTLSATDTPSVVSRRATKGCARILFWPRHCRGVGVGLHDIHPLISDLQRVLPRRRFNDGAGYVSPAPDFARDVHIERHGYAVRGQPQSHEGMRENSVLAPALPGSGGGGSGEIRLNRPEAALAVSGARQRPQRAVFLPRCRQVQPVVSALHAPYGLAARGGATGEADQVGGDTAAAQRAAGTGVFQLGFLSVGWLKTSTASCEAAQVLPLFPGAWRTSPGGGQRDGGGVGRRLTNHTSSAP